MVYIVFIAGISLVAGLLLFFVVLLVREGHQKTKQEFKAHALAQSYKSAAQVSQGARTGNHRRDFDFMCDQLHQRARTRHAPGSTRANKRKRR